VAPLVAPAERWLRGSGREPATRRGARSG
jgi:hypothetical protein